MKFDLTKYGFKATKEQDDYRIWERKVSGVVIIVHDFNGFISIDTNVDGDVFSIANRYMCTNERELEFLLINGRCGGLLDNTKHERIYTDLMSCSK